MRIYYLILGFSINRESARESMFCFWRSSSPEVLRIGEGSGPSSPAEKFSFHYCGKGKADPRPRLNLKKVGARKRCKFGRIFSPKCNRQILCSKCGELSKRQRKAEWARKYIKIG